MLCASVADNGAGMSPERLGQVRAGLSGNGDPNDDRVGYGLFNVNKRIQLYYNQPEGIRIESGETGTTVSLRVPLAGRTAEDLATGEAVPLAPAASGLAWKEALGPKGVRVVWLRRR